MIETFLARTRQARPAEPRLLLHFGLGTWVTLLILGILFPMVALTAIATRQAIDSSRSLAQTRLSDLSRALSATVDHQLRAQLVALDVLAVSPWLEGPRSTWKIAQLDAQARLVASRVGAAVALFNPRGEQIFNTLVPIGVALPPTALSDLVADVVKTKRPAVSNLAQSSVTKRLGFGVGLPLIRDGELVGVLAMLTNNAVLHELLAKQGLPESIFAALVDRNAVIIARSDARHTDLAGRTILPENAQQLARGETGRYFGYSLEGNQREFAFTKLNLATGWALVVAQSVDEFNAETDRYGNNFAILSLVAIGFGGAFALFVTRLIVKPIASLDRYAMAIGSQPGAQPPMLETSRVAQVSRLRDNLLEAEYRLKANEGRFRDILGLLDIGIFIAHRLDGTILYWSKGAADFYGWSRIEAVGQSSHTLFKTVFPDSLSDVENALQSSGSWSGELVHTTKDQRVVNVVVQMRVAGSEPETIRVLEIIHDVTELHYAQRELRLALETGQIGTFLIELPSAHVTLDERSCLLMGASQTSLTRNEFLALIPRSERSAFDAALSRCIGPRGDGILDAEIVMHGGSHAPLVVSLRGQAERHADLPVSIAGVMMDVTRLRTEQPYDVVSRAG